MQAMTTAPRWRSLLAETSVVKLDQADLAGALRCTIGVVIPLVVGLATGAVADGLAAAIGAICAGIVSFQGAYRSRVGLTLAVAAGMSLATVTGALAAKADWSAIVVVSLWGLIAGMMTSLGQASLIVGLQWCVAVIIVNALPMTAGQAVVRGAALFAGGALQTLLVVLAWPIRSYASERRAIAAAYAEVSAYAAGAARPAASAAAAEPGAGWSGLASAAPIALDEARRALNDPQPLGRPDRLVVFQALVNEADRLRLSLVSLAQLSSGLAAAPVLKSVGELFDDAAVIAASVAAAILADAPLEPTAAAKRLTAAAAGTTTALSSPSREATGPSAWMIEEADGAAEALAGQLRSALRLVGAMNGPGGRDSMGDQENADLAPIRRRHSRSTAGREALVTLRANLAWHSAVLRHAVRLALTLAAAMIVYRLSGLDHGYWIALTALIVLRPDFNQTLVRGLSRIGGTIVGAGLSTLLVAAVKPDHVGLAVMFACAVMLAFIFVRVNYAVFSICVTSYVVFLLSFAALPAPSTAADRVVATLIGGALATAAYFAWPTWESELVGSQLGALLEAQAAYTERLLSVFSFPSSPAARQLGQVRSATRLARSNAETSVQKMANEPARSRRDAPIDLDTARGVVSNGRRLSAVLVTLHAHLPAEDAAPLRPVGDFATAVAARMMTQAEDLRHRVTPSRAGERLGAVLNRLRSRQAIPSAPPAKSLDDSSLRAAHRQMASELAKRPPDGKASLPRLLSETDELVDAVNSVSALLHP
jgi:uncharacterized membrane protein YccC